MKCRIASVSLVGFMLFPFHARGQSSLAPGLRLYGVASSTTTKLVDNNGRVVHTWSSAYRPALGVYLLPDGTLLRAITGSGVQRHAFDGTLLWDYRYDRPGVQSHHDIEPLPSGNVLLIAWEEKSRAEVIDPAAQALTAASNAVSLVITL